MKMKIVLKKVTTAFHINVHTDVYIMRTEKNPQKTMDHI